MPGTITRNFAERLFRKTCVRRGLSCLLKQPIKSLAFCPQSAIKEKSVNFESIQIDTQDRRLVYIVWLRILALVCAIVAAFIFFVPDFISYLNPLLPWNEESRILGPGKIPSRHPSLDQPKLGEVIHYKTSPIFDGLPCGNLNFFISPEGIVKGIWNGEYDTSDDVHCTILAASFTGNVDPSKSCIEGNHHDPSKLYFITKGTVTMLKTSTFGNRGINGFVYFRGWLDPNYTATGELFVTQNKKSYEVFTCIADEIDRYYSSNR